MEGGAEAAALVDPHRLDQVEPIEPSESGRETAERLSGMLEAEHRVKPRSWMVWCRRYHSPLLESQEMTPSAS